MANLIPYLAFDGNCKEAMNFYKDCLGGELYIMTFGESQMANSVDADSKDKILHSSLNSGPIMLMGSDVPKEMQPEGGIKKGMGMENVALCLACKSSEEIKTFFEKLSQGADITNPLKEEFFGTFGDLTDRYGFRWMFQYSADNKAS